MWLIARPSFLTMMGLLSVMVLYTAFEFMSDSYRDSIETLNRGQI